MDVNSAHKKIASKEKLEFLQALDRRLKEFITFHNVAQTAIESLDLNEMLHNALEEVAEFMAVEVAVISFTNEQDKNSITLAHGDVSTSFINGLEAKPVRYRRVSDSHLAGAPIVIEDTERHPQLVDSSIIQEGFRSIASVPLKSSGTVIGTLFVGSHGLHPFTSEDIQLLTAFGEGLGPVLKAATLLRTVEDKNLQLVSQNEALRSHQQALLRRTKEAEEANQLKSEFLARISHELRTPLNAIIGFSELTLDEIPGPVNEDQKQCLADILSAGKHLLNLVEEVLDISKIESGRTELNLKRLSPHRILDSVGKVLAPMLSRRGQKLNIAIDDKLSGLYADESKLEQVLFNLLSNASKFSPDNAEIKVAAVRQGTQCHFSVIDRGIGINPEDRKRVFEPFFHINTPFIKDEEGTGLGLTVAKSIIEKHGGRMWLESECDAGSAFRFTVPLKPEVKRGLCKTSAR